MALEAKGSNPFTHPIRAVVDRRLPSLGVSPSGKARDFDFRTRRFKSCHPCHFIPTADRSATVGVSPSGKALDSDSSIS